MSPNDAAIGLEPHRAQEVSLSCRDGLHLTTKAYAVLWKEYTKLVKTTFKGRGLDWDDLTDLPFRVPK